MTAITLTMKTDPTAKELLAVTTLSFEEEATLRKEITGLGRDALIEKLIDAKRALKTAGQLANEEAREHRRALNQLAALTDQVTDLQKRANGALAGHRLAKTLADEPDLMVAMLDLAWGIDKARVKHPEGSDFGSLVSEVGEVAKAMYAETPERVLEELLDVLVVAMRLRLGEIKAREVTFASGPDASPEVPS